MRKFFEGHSLVGVVILFCVFFFAVFLRFYDIGTQSPWTDELASWWYLRHLDMVWVRESHSPLYYALLRVFTGPSGDLSTLRVFSAVISVIHLIECFFLGQLVFDKKRFLLFWILICLNPADIVYARMARHYAWLMEGILVYYLLWRIRAPFWLELLTGAFMGFIHVFAVIPISFLAMYRWWNDRRTRELCWRLICTNLIVVYYVLRILFLGHESVRSNVSWNSLGSIKFWSSLLTQFLGDAYPRFEFFPVNAWLALGVVGLTGIFILVRRKESGILYIGILVASLLVIEALSFWLNLRTNRYLIYLLAFWIVAFVDSFKDVKQWQAISIMGVVVSFLFFQNPIRTFPWEKEKVSEWKEFRMKYPGTQELVCSNIYQSDYYDLHSVELCRKDFLHVDRQGPLLFFDLNGNDIFVAVQLMQEMDVEDYSKLKYGLIARFVPKLPHPQKIAQKKSTKRPGKERKKK
ncbi:MAG: hypothetical protein ACJ76H_15135 [Bacteriovoracaceae bacterium]